MAEWYYGKNGERNGPFTVHQFKELAASGEIQPGTLIWKKGLKEWRKASSVKGLFPEQKESPPPLPPGSTQQASSPASATVPTVSRPATVLVEEAVAEPVSGPMPESASFLSGLMDGGKYILILGAITGVAGDFLEPLAPINTYLFAGTFVLMAIALVFWIRLPPDAKHQWDRWVPHQLLISCCAMMAGIGFWLVAGYFSEDDKGVLASLFTGVASLQESVLELDKGVGDIKEDTTAILDETRQIGANVEGIGKLGGLIKNPTTPAEIYHNARIHELSGDFSNAFAAYSQYVSFNQDFVDPYITYIELLLTQRGRQGALREFEALTTNYPENFVIEFASLRLVTYEERVKKLTEFLEEHSDFAPVLLDLANHYSEEEMPRRSELDIQTERRWLEDFLRVSNQGGLTRYYLDKHRPEELLTDAQGRLTKTSGAGESGETVSLKDGNLVHVTDLKATSIEYSFDQQEWLPTEFGKLPILCYGWIRDKRLLDDDYTTVYVRYSDQRGQWSQNYSFPISPSDKARLREFESIGQPLSPSDFLDEEAQEMINDPTEQLRETQDMVNDFMGGISIPGIP